ncbi:MAG: STAS domain-containing protein [Spirochaetales bacterium]|nr:STAS domain-containing protein [Spirochaetales bacterium]
MSSGKYFFAEKDGVCFFKLDGDLKYTESSKMDNFLKNIYEENEFSNFKLDLSHANYLDSTVLGIIANLSAFVIDSFSHKLDLYSDNPDIVSLLTNSGFEEVCSIHCELLNLDLDYKEIESEETDLGQMMLDAHKKLAELDVDNREKYNNFVNILSSQISGNSSK